MRLPAAMACLVLAVALPASSAASSAPAPGAPANVAVSAPDRHSLLVTWAWQPNTTYRVRWRERPGRWQAHTVGAVGRLLLRHLSGPSARYDVQLRACQRRCSAWSPPLGAGAPVSGPGTPSAVGQSGTTGAGGQSGTPSPGDQTGTPSAGDEPAAPSAGDQPGTPSAGGEPAAPSAGPSSTTIGGCSVFPSNNPWNQDISALPVDPNSDRYIAAINSYGDTFLHADFGADPSYGIPFRVVNGAAPTPINFTEYPSESDPGPYPIPTDTPIEAGSDHHVLVVDSSSCKLYELYHAQPNADGGWDAGSGAVFDLNSNALRPDTWTSTDEAGLPVLPGLVRYDEVAAGQINHALRFTVAETQRAFIHPATHYGSADNTDDPPMGLRLRLRADFDLSSFHGEALVVLQALKRYGMFVADTGTSWYISGATDPRWSDDDLDQLKTVPGTAFEVVQTGPINRP